MLIDERPAGPQQDYPAGDNSEQRRGPGARQKGATARSGKPAKEAPDGAHQRPAERAARARVEKLLENVA